MSAPRFESLREKLLRAGIAPRHVRRYLKELRQHYDDLIAEEIAGGVTGDEARRVARARLGTDDELAAAMLGEPSLRSVSARCPWAVFSIVPLLTLVAALFLATVTEMGFLKLHLLLVYGSAPSNVHAPDWLKSMVAVWDATKTYAFPALVAALFSLVALRQRIRLGWLVPGIMATMVLGASVTSGVMWSDVPGQSELSVSVGGGSELAPRLYLSIAIGLAMVALQWWYMRRRVLVD